MKPDIRVDLWDENAARVMESEKSLFSVLVEMGVSARVQINSEPPMIVRSGMAGKTPAIQVNGGDIWTYTPSTAMTCQSLRNLLMYLRKTQNL